MKQNYVQWDSFALFKGNYFRIFILIFSLLCSFEGFAQTTETTLVSIQVKDKSITEVLTALNKKVKLRFMYNPQDLAQLPKTSLNIKNQPLKQVLETLFKNSGMQWSIEGGVLLIKKAAQVAEVKNANRNIISGTVKDESGAPLVRASIKDLQSNTGMFTDERGSFRMGVDDNTTLSISYLGMVTVKVNVQDKEALNHIVLKRDNNNLQEVVVNTGYEKIDTRRLTSAVTTIKVSDILTPGINTIDQLLEGRVPGMIYMQNSGQVGAAPRLRIRGTSTILGNQEPLWVIDGIVHQDPINISPSQLNDLDFVNLLGNAVSGLNPEDIEQVDILKDAAATAIYGARAANGVIVVTTKQGKIGPPVIGYSLSGTFSTRPRYTDGNVDVMNSLDRTALSRELIQSGVIYPRVQQWVGYESAYIDYYNKKITYDEMKQQVGQYETVNTDWFGLLLQDAFSQKHTISLSGGTGTVKYYASLGYNDINGNIKNESNNVYSALTKITANYNRFTFSFGLQADMINKKYGVNNEMNYAMNTSRVVPAYQNDGSYWYYGLRSGYNGNTIYDYNILNEVNNSSNITHTSGISLNSTIDYKIIKPLSFGLTAAYQVDNTAQEEWHGYNSYYSTLLRAPVADGTISPNSTMPYGDELKENNQRREAYTVRGQFNLNQYVGDGTDHLISATLGAELSSNHYIGKAQTSRGYLPERGKQMASFNIGDFPSYQYWLSSEEALGVRTDQLTNLASAYLSLSYNYKDKYLFNFNTRTDASNKFGDQSNDKFLPIWSVSGRWNAKADIFANVDFVNTLSIRGSFGYQGNMLPTQSPELVIKKGSLSPIYGEYVSTVDRFPNPYLQWEKTSSMNVGLDFGLFNNKLQGSLSYYYKKTKDAFLEKEVSNINGLTSYVVNSGTLENQGFEMQLNFVPINTLSANKQNGFRWNFDPQIGQVLNKFLNDAIGNKDKVLRDEVTFSDYLNGNVDVAGKPLNTFYSYRFAGLDHNDGRPTYYGTDPSMRDAYAAMDKKDVYEVVMTPSGSRVPVLQGGLSNSFSYKRFNLSFNMVYSFGSKIRLTKLYPNLDISQGTTAPLPIQNARNELSNRWKVPGDELNTNLPAILSNQNFLTTTSPWWAGEINRFGTNIWEMYDFSDSRVVSGNYLKMQSISWRYSFSEEFCKKIQMKSAYIGLSGTNIFTVAAKELKGQDPTTQTGSGTIPMSLRPAYSLSLNVSF